ncbi:NUDIX domain-containing protein [Deinococcus pimensis]|uniref:NUDIX domain-containing protein n=1 Tax=Deinococcus pimensis TaxID=309888 RepID=UPI00048513E8|nr:NUDIX domain-containing protein [Deinococcus pimensis]
MDPYIRNLRAKIGHDLVKAPAAGVVVRDEGGRVLLVRRADDGTWGIPGGWAGPGENVTLTAVREAREETGWDVEITGLLGVYSEPEHMRLTYPNGDMAEFVNVIFEGRAVTHHGGFDDETLEVRFFAPEELPEIRATDAWPVRDAVSDAPRPFVR